MVRSGLQISRVQNGDDHHTNTCGRSTVGW